MLGEDGCFEMWMPELFFLKSDLPFGGPKTSYKWGEITSTSNFTAVTHLFSAIYRSYNSIYN